MLTHFDVFVEKMKPVKFFKLIIFFPRFERKISTFLSITDLLAVNVNAKSAEPVVEFSAKKAPSQS